MDIVVRLRFAVAHALREERGHQALPPIAMQLLTTLDSYGAEIRPQHPGSTDPQLMTFFTVVGVTGDKVAQLQQALMDLEAVDGAYTKPTAAMP